MITKCFNLLPIWHMAWSNFIARGMPCRRTRSWRNLKKFFAFALSNFSADKIFEKWSMQTNAFRCFSLEIDPPKSYWVSSLRNLHSFNGAHLLAEKIDFKFHKGFTWPCLITNLGAWMAMSGIPELPGCVAFIASMYASLMGMGIAILSSTQTKSISTWNSL